MRKWERGQWFLQLLKVCFHKDFENNDDDEDDDDYDDDDDNGDELEFMKAALDHNNS